MEFVVFIALGSFLLYIIKSQSIYKISVAAVCTVALLMLTSSTDRPEDHAPLHKPHLPRVDRQVDHAPEQKTLPSRRNRALSRDTPIKHVLFVKTHKTGSTTIFGILAEYCRTNNLIPLMPQSNHINLFYPFFEPENFLQFAPGVTTYDMVFNHNIFLPDIYRYLHNDTFTFTILRDPQTNFLSSFNFFGLKGGYDYLINIPGPNKLEYYFEDPDKFEPYSKYVSFTDNRQSLDLGYNITYDFNDTDYIQTFIQHIDKSLDVVLIMEYFDESMILLKRMLGWTTQDILYFIKVKAPERIKANKSLTARQKVILAKRTVADSSLYRHFLNIFKNLLKQTHGLAEEVNEFREVLEKLKRFCDDGEPASHQLHIPPGRWTDEVSILRTKCKWLHMKEFEWTANFKNEQSKY